MTINRDKLLSECKRKVFGLLRKGNGAHADFALARTGHPVCPYWGGRLLLLDNPFPPTGQNACPYWAERLLLLGRIAVTATIGL